ncbi:regulatory protein, MarR [Mycolicibacterium brisbanense]|uniref:Regulatory protein, MarR n=1 Tax=Mycolicibacterium brisbanense TaxID=146020 RepID=A0A100VV06_9MYCO|nr:regulatory protein, MarR [Mycolicibacterium brisbanense]
MGASVEVVGPLLDYLARRLRAELEAELMPLGLKARHMIALTVLREFGERGQSDLGHALGVDATTTVALLNDLESLRLVERRHSPQDRRRHTVVITAAERRLQDCEAIVASLECRMFDIDTGQRSQLRALSVQCAAGAADGPQAPMVTPLAGTPN